MTLVPIAAFEAGALLSLLLPTVMLTALVVWYVFFVRRAPGPADGSEPANPASNPAQGAASDPGQGAATEAERPPKDV